MAHELQTITPFRLIGPLPQKFFFRGILTFLMTLCLLQPPLAFAASPEFHKQSYGGTLRLPSYGQPAPLDPFKLTDTISFPLLDLIFNKLVRWNNQGEFEGDLTERWEISEDGRVYTFHLRPGIRFHDGKSCDTQDVLYSFQLFSNPAISPVYYRYFEVVEKWEALSDSVFTITLKKPFAPFLWYLWKVMIVPRHRLDPLTDQSLAAYIRQPMGTGPFQFEKQEQDGTMIFKANQEYFEGRPYLDQIVILPIAKERVWPAFLRNEIDMVFYLDEQNYRQVKDAPSFQIVRVLSFLGYVLIFNLDDALLGDINIRNALSYAVDRQELIHRLEDGNGMLTNGPFYPQSWANDSESPSLVYDPQKAKTLLVAAGFTETPEGLMRNDRPLILNILVDQNNEHLIRMAKTIRQQLQEIGAQTKISFYSDFHGLGNKAYQKKFQSFLSVYKTGPEPDIASEYWDSRSHFNPYANLRTYKNMEVDDLFEKGRKNHERQARTQIYHRLHNIIEHDKPALFLYFPSVYFAAQKGLQVNKNIFTSYFSFFSLRDVYRLNLKNEKGGG